LKITLPTDLDPSMNGRLWPNQLTPVLFPGTGMGTLHPNSARAWNAMALIFKLENPAKQLTAVSRGDIYRTLDMQERLFRSRFVRLMVSTVVRIWLGVRWWKLPGVALAATPGNSNHGLGLAVDIAVWIDGKTKVSALAADEASQAWMRREAASFGWYENVKSEPWHWEFCVGNAMPQRVLDIERFLTAA
jgi:D-alanyl-D-alanine carboxypeptidase